ncbi:MAG: hypothetical protein ABSB26_00650 [Nitrososphaerales archaeon]|jgi:hypothetical protein
MYVAGARRRVRPGVKSLILSSAVCPAALYLASGLPFDGFYEPLSATLLVSIAVSWYRVRGLRRSLPEPYGRGGVTTVDPDSATRSGLLITLGGAVLMVGLMGSVFFLPPVAFFAVVFGLTAGLPLSVIVFFVQVSRLERISQGRIYSVIEETEVDEETVLRKTCEIVPRIRRMGTDPLSRQNVGDSRSRSEFGS